MDFIIVNTAEQANSLLDTATVQGYTARVVKLCDSYLVIIYSSSKAPEYLA